jgi:hypothetical protein
VFRVNKYYLGVDSNINNNNSLHIFMADIDYEYFDFISIIRALRPFNILIYKTKHGYHMISLNIFTFNELVSTMRFINNQFPNLIDEKFIKYTIINRKATLRLSLKKNETWILKYWKCGKFSISQKHYELYNTIFNNKLIINKRITKLENLQMTVRGYTWNLDMVKDKAKV